MIGRKDVIKFIPHRHPFIMVDSLLSIENNVIKTMLFISNNNFFVKNGEVMSVYGLLEHIAQSTMLGYSFAQLRKFGFIGKITNCKAYKEAIVGYDIYSEIYIKNYSEIYIKKELSNSILVQGKCSQRDELLLVCTLYLHFD